MAELEPRLVCRACQLPLVPQNVDTTYGTITCPYCAHVTRVSPEVARRMVGGGASTAPAARVARAVPEVCPACQLPVVAENVTLGLLKCPYCLTETRLDGEPEPLPRVAPSLPQERAPLPPPDESLRTPGAAKSPGLPAPVAATPSAVSASGGATFAPPIAGMPMPPPDVIQKLPCRACGGPLEPEDMDAGRNLVTCRHCGTINPVQIAAGHLAADALPQSAPALPSGLALKESPEELVFTYDWFTLVNLAGLIFILIWNAGLVYMLVNVLSNPLTRARGSSFLPFIMIPFILVGLGTLYSVLASCVNTTQIIVNKLYVELRHGPLPMMRNLTLDVQQIRQLFCVEHVQRSSGRSHRRGGHRVTTRTHVTRRYVLRALMADGRTHDLTTNSLDPQLVLYLEAAIEQFLGIKNETVAGEMVPGVRRDSGWGA